MKEKLSFKREYLPRTIFQICNFVFFALVTIAMIIPIFKIIVDSIEGAARYGINLWPRQPTLQAYKLILTTRNLYMPFLMSILTTITGTFLGLVICTTSAYVLIHKDLPGQKFFSYMLLFTMVFNGGLIPTYLAMRSLRMVNTLWVILLPAAVSVYNIILMRNFFEGIPISLFESAELDGCRPMAVFTSIVLPLSIPAIASIGLFYAVSFWNMYTPYAIYITNTNLYNFQVRLREIIIDDQTIGGAQAYMKAVQNAIIIVAMVPFLLVYPFIQRYFVTGVTMGAVKE
ncbi:MAG: carbohydrate ABC transporter permease [Treponema sp.]|jgi:putative aldouronate transport system permease protein|nr:carbohydrate ABC transporter permease [Treponema sp.]